MINVSFLLIAICYLILLTIIGVLSMGIDKYRARHNQYRIAEKTLFLIAILRGSIGSICGMHLFRHKTKHTSFVYGIPAILIIQIGIGIVLVYMVK